MIGYLEESWLFEAISETYIPLLSSFFKLIEENIDFETPGDYVIKYSVTDKRGNTASATTTAIVE